MISFGGVPWPHNWAMLGLRYFDQKFWGAPSNGDVDTKKIAHRSRSRFAKATSHEVAVRPKKENKEGLCEASDIATGVVVIASAALVVVVVVVVVEPVVMA